MQIRGIDVSSYQRGLSWQQATADGAQFGLAKRSEGTGGVDDAFDAHWQGIKAQGLPRGGYAFSRWDLGTDAGAEAAHFLALLPSLDDHDFLVLDIEDSPDRVPGRELSGWALTWLDAVERATGRAPLVYTGASFGSQFLTDARLARYGLIVAAYGAVCPAQVGPWLYPAAWQHTNRASYAGQLVDESYFFGSADQLRAYGKPPATPPPPTPPPTPRTTGARYLITRDMMARSAPDLDAVSQPVQMLYKGAVLGATGAQTPHWAEVVAGGKKVWAFLPNMRPV